MCLKYLFKLTHAADISLTEIYTHTKNRNIDDEYHLKQITVNLDQNLHLKMTIDNSIKSESFSRAEKSLNFKF